MKKLLSLIILAVLALSLPAFADAPVVEEVKYEGGGFLEIEFVRDVQYENLTVTVVDASGAAAPATIVEMDDDELDIWLENAQFEMQYTITVSGVRSGNSGSYETFTVDLAVPPESALFINEVDADPDDDEVEVSFIGRVEYDHANLAATITDENGNALDVSIHEYDNDDDDDGNDDLELRVKGLEYGKEYTITLTGVGRAGTGLFEGTTAEFKVWDD